MDAKILVSPIPGRTASRAVYLVALAQMRAVLEFLIILVACELADASCLPTQHIARSNALHTTPLMAVSTEADLAVLRVERTTITEEQIFNGVPFPLTLQPREADASLLALAEEYRDSLLELVEQYDCVLLRGFGAATDAMDFSRFASTLKLGDFDAGCSAAPRTNVAPGVFTANEAPPTEPVPFHHEMAQCDECVAWSGLERTHDWTQVQTLYRASSSPRLSQAARLPRVLLRAARCGEGRDAHHPVARRRRTLATVRARPSSPSVRPSPSVNLSVHPLSLTVAVQIVGTTRSLRPSCAASACAMCANCPPSTTPAR